ncbi:putative bifunctional diguanylate cyclase/phosphodiesterase [Devosia sp.]|uniref:putative bifunctional diguanylate cyclase/phosphodiesterase n=1 Tax=Devosia sp. TaxID=1871048 RepID=UPI003A93DD90
MLRSHRLVIGVGLTFIVAVALLSAAAALVPDLVDAQAIMWVGGAAGLTLIGLLIWSYFQMRKELQAAAHAHGRLIAASMVDEMTGAQTRAAFLKGLRQLLGGTPQRFAYMQIDMDNLKVLNDSMGHSAGDMALAHMVKSLQTLVPEAKIGRLGGDEFGIIVAGDHNHEALLRLGHRMLEQIGKPINVHGRPVRISGTIGVARAPDDAIGAHELLSKADLALYKGKRSGRAKVVAFDSELLADERHKRFIDRELRAAILTNELELHYQPIFSAGTLQPVSHEALVRWYHPLRGLISPGDFISIAEESDLIDLLGLWVLRRACMDLSRLRTPTVGINVSVMQLRRPEFADRVLEVLEETDVQPDQIVLEVTESLPLGGDSIEIEQIRTLRERGVKIAIDDFGAGYASLKYLRNCPFDIIKIDRSYTQDLPDSQIDGLIVAAICEIGRALDVEIIAEGIETEAQQRCLQAAGVTALQGYLLARPERLSFANQIAVSVA